MFNLYIYSGILSFVCSLSGVICSFKILVSSTTRVDRFDLQDREEDEDVLMTTPKSIRSSDLVNGRPAARVGSNDSDESENKGEFL